MTAARRARKKANRRRGQLRCEDCDELVRGEAGDHDSALSHTVVTWDGLAVVAWCPFCGGEIASGGAAE